MKDIDELIESNWFQVWNNVLSNTIIKLQNISYNSVNGLVYAHLKNGVSLYELSIPSSLYLNDGSYVSGKIFLIDWKTETVSLEEYKEIEWHDIDFEKTFGIAVGYFDCWKSAWEWIAEFILKTKLPMTVHDGYFCKVHWNILAKDWMFHDVHFVGSRSYMALPCRINLLMKRFDILDSMGKESSSYMNFSSLFWYKSFKFIPIISKIVTSHAVQASEISKSEIKVGRAYHWDTDSDFNLYLENIKGGYEVHAKSLYTSNAENFELPESDKYLLECELDDLEHMEYDRLWSYLWWFCEKYEGGIAIDDIY